MNAKGAPVAIVNADRGVPLAVLILLGFIVALDSPIANPVAIAVIAASDAVLLLLERGVTGIPQARRIVEIVGRDRLIGAVFDVS